MSFEPRRTPTRAPRPLGMLVSIIAVGAIVGGAYIFFFDPLSGPIRVGNPNSPGAQSDAAIDQPGSPGSVARPERVTIPAIGVDGPVLEMRLGSDGLWDADSIIGEVGHLQGTPIPGEGGNAVLAAHVTVPGGAYGPFKDLETMQPGNSVTIWGRDGTVYNYEVTGNAVVLATAIEVVAPTEEPTLTLITCTGWDHNQATYLERVVITARLTSVTPPAQ